MARGEEATPKRALGGLAVLGLLLASGVCVLTGVLLTERTADTAAREPFDGMTSAFSLLTSQDAYGASAAESRRLAEEQVARRGYVPVPSDVPVQLMTLPLEFDAQGFDGACGVLLAVGDSATSITRVALPSGSAWTPHDPHVGVVAVCAAAHIRVEGTGSIALHPWLFPGLTSADLAPTSIPTEVALAHAEAAHMISASGFEPTDEVVVLSSAAGQSNMPIARRPASGCVPFVVVAIGADSLSTLWITGDASPDRSVTGGALCATRQDGMPTFSSSTAATLYLRTYRASSSARLAGPAMGALHVVSEAALDLTHGLPENPTP